MGRRLLFLVVLVLLAAVPAAGALAASDDVIEVVDIRGVLDQRTLDFMVDAISTSSAKLVVIQLRSPGIGSGDPGPLFDLVASPPVPVAVWAGPAPAEAFGGSAVLLHRARYSGAAPDSRTGFLEPVVQRGEAGVDVWLDPDREDPTEWRSAAVVVAEPVPGLVDAVVPTLGQFLVGLDGEVLETAAGPVVVATARTAPADGGGETTVVAGTVRFLEPDLPTRFLRLGAAPEAAFLFLVIGLALVAFEFYAAGVGITAAVAVLALVLGGYGVAVLPVDPVAVGLTGAGVLAYAAAFQRGRIGVLALFGTGFLLAGGFRFTTASPQFGPKGWAVVLTVLGTAAFFAVAMPSVIRSRFSTRTIGREYLVGRRGIAETPLEPEGVVSVDGARWRARTQRAAGVRPGDEVEVVAISGVVLEVTPHHP